MYALHCFHHILHSMHDALRRLDLNLLLLFDALYRHRSVVAAADELSMSPSACSHALARLRSSLSDELFIRYGSGMRPTDLADQLAVRVGDALGMIAEGLGSGLAFEPGVSANTFVFAATDFTALAVLPSLIRGVSDKAPHIHLKVVYSAHRDAMDDLSNGRAHFVFGIADEFSVPDNGVEAIDCYTDDYVVAVRRHHPRIKKQLSLKNYLAERHVAVVPWSDAGSVIDAALAREGVHRDVAVQLPSLMSAPFIVANSDFLITVPRRSVEQLGDFRQLAIHAAPFRTPEYTVKIFFHARFANAPGHRWLRDQMLLASQS